MQISVNTRKAFAAVGCATALLAPLRLEAQNWFLEKYLPIMPPYCRYTQMYRERVEGGNNPAEIKRWYDTLGDTFHNMHHYCGGLGLLHAAKFDSRTPQERESKLAGAIGEFTYQIDRTPPDHVLMPEFLNSRADAQIRLGKGNLAVPDLLRAIELRPDWWPSSITLSDYYKSVGKTDLAREVLEKALAASPDSNTLRSRLANLDAEKGARQATPQRSAKRAVSKQSAKTVPMRTDESASQSAEPTLAK